jgi:predicted permease
MRWLRPWLLRLIGLFGKERRERELAAEMESHLRLHIEDNLRAGMSAAKARRQALMKLGGMEQTKQAYRERRGLPVFETLSQDVRYSARMLRKNPGFTCVAVLTLALGIGANTAIFSMSDAVMLKLLPARNPKQLVYFRLLSPEEHGSAFTRAEFEQIRDLSHSFSSMFAFDTTRLVVNVDRQPDFVWGQCVSGNFYSVLGVNPSVGRALTSDDDQPGSPAVVVISYDYWKRKFALDSSIAGKPITLKGIPFSIVGVAPARFRGIELGDSTDIWVPLAFWEQLRLNDHLTLGVMARMKPGADEKQANAELTLIDQQFTAAALGSKISPQAERDLHTRSVEMVPGGRGFVDLPDELPRSLLVLTMVVGLVLLIACANVANLLLARAVNREKEIALRLALGAPRMRLFRQLFAESFLLAVAGGALGLLFTTWTTSFLVRLLSDGDTLQALDIHTDVRTFYFALAVSLFTCLLFGIAPAFWATRMDTGLALKGVSSSKGANTPHLGPRKVLVISQVSLSVLLLVGAGLLARSLQRLSIVDTGFRQENVLLVSIYPTLSGYDGARELALYARAQERVSAAPGVLSAAFSRFSMLSGGRWIRVASPFASTSNVEKEVNVNCNPVAPRFFETMGIPIILGSDFTAADGQEAPRVAVVSESFARKYFPNEDPLGKQIRFKDGKVGEPIAVVGVVKEVKSLSLWEREPVPQMYVPLAQAPPDLLGQVTLEVRTAMEPATVVTAVRDAMHDVDASLPLAQVITQKAQMEGTLQNERSLSTLSTLFGVLALVLACLGLYGIAAYSVAARTREIGIRMALGAPPVDVLRMVIRQGMRLALTGVVVGLAGAFALSRALSSLLFEISGADSLIYAGVAILLTLVALAASYIPARRAARVDPMVALRYE